MLCVGCSFLIVLPRAAVCGWGASPHLRLAAPYRIAHYVGYVPVENPPPRGGGAGRRAQLAPKFSCAAGSRKNKEKV